MNSIASTQPLGKWLITEPAHLEHKTGEGPAVFLCLVLLVQSVAAALLAMHSSPRAVPSNKSGSEQKFRSEPLNPLIFAN